MIIRNFDDFGAFIHHVAFFQSALCPDVVSDCIPFLLLDVQELPSLVEYSAHSLFCLKLLNFIDQIFGAERELVTGVLEKGQLPGNQVVEEVVL